MLKIEHLCKSFGSKRVLDDLNLEVADSSIFALVGIYGAGKSTLLRLIAGVYEADAGSITLHGADTSAEPLTRREIAFVPDEAYYPVNNERNDGVYGKYKALADEKENVIFGGRLGMYRYYDMDKVIRAALDTVKEELS